MSGAIDITKVTIKGNFSTYMEVAFPDVEKGKTQWRTMELVWFSAYLECLMNMRDRVGHPDVPEEVGIDFMNRLADEAMNYHKDMIRRGMQQ